jgi:hypothetical protein
MELIDRLIGENACFQRVCCRVFCPSGLADRLGVCTLDGALFLFSFLFFFFFFFFFFLSSSLRTFPASVVVVRVQ